MRYRDEAAEPTSRPTGSEPRRLGDLLGGLTQRPAWRARLEGAEVYRSWASIAGPQLAQHTEPVRLHRGVLIVRAATPAWATQLRFLAGAVAERANAVLGAGSVLKVRVVAGRLRGTASDDD